jgi:class 3 adenylate cyclase/tetratricopeptide (TPR) repeat protein
VITCPACGKENPEGFAFCGFCTAPLATETAPGREERKVVTVLFCDLVGSTARAERLDPEDVRALLSRYHEHVRGELERFGGTVEKFIGDAVVGVFGAPAVHEDDSERAVRAALAVRDWARESGEVEIRIAVNTGEALVALDARPELGQAMVAGDVMNTAARLQGAAPENGVLVGETTYRATRDVIDYREAPPVRAKGKSEPLAVWEAREARARVQVERMGRTPLVGRDRELSALSDALERARDEHSPQLVTLVGVPGIGKSRLVYELFKLLEGGSELVSWRQGRSLPYGEGVSYWALAEVVKAEAGILETDDEARAAERLAATVGQLFAEEADARWVEGHLRPLVGLGAERESSDDRTAEAFAAWRRFLEALAERRPLVLVFEDLHFADDGLLDFVDYLAEWAGEVPLLIVATARPELLERRPAWGGGKVNALTLALAPLSQEQTAGLVHALLDWPVLPAGVEQQLLDRAGGNPLYAEEFARLVEEGLEPEQLPESVQGIIAARLDGLPAEEKAVLHDAAVLGRVFWLGGLEHVGGGARWTVEERLHRLERKEFVRRERGSSVAGEAEYSFKHLLVRDVAYGQVPRAERAARHRLAAEWITSLGRADDHAELVANHYLAALELARAAGEATDALVGPARLALRDAGDRAFALNAFAAASGFYEAALDVWPEKDAARPALLLRFGQVLHLTADDRRIEVLEQARAALVECEDRPLAAEAEVALGGVRWLRGETSQVAAHVERAEALVRDEPSSTTKVRVLAQLSRYLALGGDTERALVVGREAQALAEELGLVELAAHALNNIAVAKYGLGDAGAVADFERSIALATSVSSPEAARGYNNLGATLWDLGEVGRARVSFEEAARVARERGDLVVGNYAANVVASLNFNAGRWDEALGLIEETISRSEAGEPNLWEGLRRGERGFIRLGRGDFAGALGDARVAAERASQARIPIVIPFTFGAAIDLHVELGLLDEAATLSRELLAGVAKWVANIGTRIGALRGFVTSAEVLGLSGEARQLIEPASETNGWRAPLLALLDGDLVAGADGLDRLETREPAARLRLRAAERLAAAGDQAAADRQVAEAIAFFRSVDANAWIRRAETLLTPAA